MRTGELVIIRTRDIERGAAIWYYKPAKHKTEHHGHARLIPLGPQAQAILQPYLKPDSQAFLFSPAQAKQEWYAEKRRLRKTKVQPSQMNRRKNNPKRPPGAHYDRHTSYRAIQYAIKKAKKSGVEISRWHPHQLRHSVATPGPAGAVAGILPRSGERFQGVLPPLAERRVFTIRKRAVIVFTLDDYVDKGILSVGGAAVIRQTVADRKKILVAGGTGSGKTTLVNAILAEPALASVPPVSEPGSTVGAVFETVNPVRPARAQWPIPARSGGRRTRRRGRDGRG